MSEFEKTCKEIEARLDTTGYWTEFKLAMDATRILLLIAEELHELNKKKED